ncbi:hypothetical protein SMGD1_0266 [Sulfurimonas gotlandica GD1]|uniref:HNH nuclease domain-containing protein n=1 Tax=Sulfurimonas gotlandica (strain DSM 19862 / JCM 16533 / GD1) TaxID=929558 RepID=B6BL56_SULGG|nr:HNH endonuclease domain-containing protein [Sulfurimonas gotlandica]EDZ62129.1 hypothetical protein CBGD1_2709 [Sulfurimonas gotlandica GD1]EHP28793.1 hypothetical protein SMGD1_0266 [Sulfurimonas gotlandica GD1]
MIDVEALKQISYIIENDSTSSTYKYVLLKSVINASQKYEHLIEVKDNRASIPIGLIVEQWILDYMPFVFKNISQQNSGTVLDKPIIANYNKIFYLLNLDRYVEWEYAYMQFIKSYKSSNLSLELSNEFFKLARKMAKKIVSMPMRYIGRSEYEFFTPDKESFADIKLENGMMYDSSFLVREFGSFSISEQHYNIFRYLGQTLYGTSTILSKWKQKTLALNVDQSYAKDMIDKLSSDTLEVRNTSAIRNILNEENECVWSGKELSGTNYDVDHVLPFSVWFNNDLWNMLPTDRDLNQRRKKNKIPSPTLIENRSDVIKRYWHDYFKEFPLLFKSQVEVSLTGTNVRIDEFMDVALDSLCRKSHYLINDRGHTPFYA